ncbi:TIGR02147 family protein [Bdellovibrio sp. HCB337]|uniref:TIGR02147 family protein n=1 Tax=Bdellovibrio sp. HCB337 TaxID=3394358 RepID=UPI0039A71A75
MIFQYTDYRDYLQSLLQERKKRNVSYSMRAFARSLNIPVSTLCDVLNKNKNLTLDGAKKVTMNLGFQRDENRYFNLLIEKELLEKSPQRLQKEEEILSLSQLALRQKVKGEEKDVLNHALKFAIIELGGIPEFKLTPITAATALRLSEDEADLLLQSLTSSGALKFCETDQCYRKSGSGVLVSSEVMNINLRRFHMEMMELAKKSLAEQTPQERFVGSETFSFDSHQLTEANDIIEECFAKLVTLANRGERKDSVYHVGIQMFRLTRAGSLT